MPGTGRDPAGMPVPSEETGQAGPRDLKTQSVRTSKPSDIEDFFHTAEAAFGDDPGAWLAIQEELERRIARQREWGQSVEAAAARAQDDLARPEQAQGGAMTTHPDLLAKPRRPFTGYDRERATFERMKSDLLVTAEGKFVVIVGDEAIGPMDSHAEAERAGYAAFGLGPLYVKKVLAEEPIAEVTRLVAS